MSRITENLSRFLSSRQGFAVPFVMLPVWIFFAAIGQFARGEIVWLMFTVVIMIARVRWELHAKRWFWSVLAAFALAHAPLIWLNPLEGKHLAGGVIVPFMFLDYALAYGLVFLCEKWPEM